jgi:hypothetical protein
MAFIRAAGNAMKSSDVTRYSVTRYIARSKFENDKTILEKTQTITKPDLYAS